MVVAPAGLTLGGGCEVALHGDRVQAAAETYMGLVEVGVGLIPAGGGTKEMLARAMDGGAWRSAIRCRSSRRAFETDRVRQGVDERAGRACGSATSRPSTAITMNRERLMADAKAVALDACATAISRPRRAPRSGSAAKRCWRALKLGVHLAWRAGRISDHDALIGRKLARILAGGDAAARRRRSPSSDLLDLEREAFLSLCGERKTQERIQHTLKTGKTLRN